MHNVGIIGAGRIAHEHAKAVLALADTQLLAAADISAVTAEAFATTYGCTAHTDYRELLARNDLDYVVIALPHHLHAEVGIATAKAGKHIFMEKPLALTVDECDAIIAAAYQAGVALHVGHHHHFIPANLKLKAMLDSEQFGPVIMATDVWLKAFFSEPRPPWFLDRACGGGMWLMNGPHLIDRLMFFLNSTVVSVIARVGSAFHGLSAADFAQAHLLFANGTTAQIVHAGYKDGVNRFNLTLTCLEAELKLTGITEVAIGREDKWTTVPVEAGNCHQAQHSAFIRCLMDGIGAPVTGDWGREVVRVLLACEDSSMKGSTRRFESTEIRLD